MFSTGFSSKKKKGEWHPTQWRLWSVQTGYKIADANGDGKNLTQILKNPSDFLDLNLTQFDWIFKKNQINPIRFKIKWFTIQSK
jgi:hypothetical protein